MSGSQEDLWILSTRALWAGKKREVFRRVLSFTSPLMEKHYLVTTQQSQPRRHRRIGLQGAIVGNQEMTVNSRDAPEEGTKTTRFRKKAKATLSEVGLLQHLV